MDPPNHFEKLDRIKEIENKVCIKAMSDESQVKSVQNPMVNNQWIFPQKERGIGLYTISQGPFDNVSEGCGEEKDCVPEVSNQFRHLSRW